MFPVVSQLLLGHTPSTAGIFWKKFRKNSGKTPETLSELFLEFPSRVRLGSPKPYNSRHLGFPEHFQNCLPPNTAGGTSFFRIGSGEGLSELVMEFPAVLRAFLNYTHTNFSVLAYRSPKDKPNKGGHRRKNLPPKPIALEGASHKIVSPTVL